MEIGDGLWNTAWRKGKDTVMAFRREWSFTICAGSWEIGEMSFYGFTADNTKRPVAQRQAFTRACVAAVDELSREDASLLVIGNTASPMFPKELLPFTSRQDFGKGGMKINFLVNYSWEWDMGMRGGVMGPGLKKSGDFPYGSGDPMGRQEKALRFSSGSVGVFRYICGGGLLAGF